MIKGEYHELQEMAKNNVCAEHQAALEVAWHDGQAVHVLRCGHGEYPDGLLPITSPKQAVKRGELAPKEKFFGALPTTDLGSGQLLVPELIQHLIKYAERYGLDAYRGHVVLMYSKPYITLDGYLWTANQSKQPYKLASRPATNGERQSLQIKEGDHCWIADLEIRSPDRCTRGIGIVTAEEITEEAKGKPGQLRSPVVAKHPQMLAQKRAEWQALRRGFPIGEEKEEVNQP